MAQLQQIAANKELPSARLRNTISNALRKINVVESLFLYCRADRARRGAGAVDRCAHGAVIGASSPETACQNVFN